jgi:DnaK suppressor protein
VLTENHAMIDVFRDGFAARVAAVEGVQERIEFATANWRISAGMYPVVMDSDRARQLLAHERQRIEQALAVVDGPVTGAAVEHDEPGDGGSESLYQNELDAGLAKDLAEQLAAVERAEARLAAGTYGLSVESGQPIPDERLEALPAAELTVEEQQRRERS